MLEAIHIFELCMSRALKRGVIGQAPLGHALAIAKPYQAGATQAHVLRLAETRGLKCWAFVPVLVNKCSSSKQINFFHVFLIINSYNPDTSGAPVITMYVQYVCSS